MENARYVLDATSSQLTVQAFAEGLAGIADHRPRFSVREFSVELEFDPNKPEDGSLHLTAKTGSLEIIDEVSQHDRKAIERVMFDEVLHPERFPEVTFRSSRVICTLREGTRYRVETLGTITLHGEENVQRIQAQLILSNESIRVYGEFRLLQSEYGLAIASVAGGMLRIKNELKFVFFFVARKQAGTATGVFAARV